MTSTKYLVHDIPFLVVFLFVFIIGFTLNLFLAAVDFPDWLKGRKVKASVKIQCVLALSRFFLLCFSLMQVLMSVSGQDEELIINSILTFFNISVNYTGLWYLTLWSVLFFLKIADRMHALFIRLKVVMTRRLMCFTVGVTIIAFGSAVLHVWGLESALKDAQPRNVTNAACKPLFSVLILYSVATGNSGPFIIYSVSFIMLVTSLCRHMIQMRSSVVGLSKSNLDSYYVAIKTLAVCYLIFGLQVGANVLGSTYLS
uniref:Taste receptor type 2 n=1 Tax=Leptobrachium leishanense TaxID=445787 RepID=A0A8C5QIQ2_9ANUR